ncbi:MAG: response regulator [Calditrichaeota bacterium]|nr:MAG: response regulator [Calditrichota bacterium]
MKILIVEDSGMMRKAISKVVITTGFEPLLAENGQEALKQLQENSSDVGLVIMDWNMPVMDGYEALIAIRADQTFKDIPVLMATSEGIAEDIQKATKAGANGYMVKPFSMSDLSLKIKELIEA